MALTANSFFFASQPERLAIPSQKQGEQILEYAIPGKRPRYENDHQQIGVALHYKLKSLVACFQQFIAF
jgi:hypothetical protein